MSKTEVGLLHARACHRLSETLSTRKRQERSLPFSASLTCSPVESQLSGFPHLCFIYTFPCIPCLLPPDVLFCPDISHLKLTHGLMKDVLCAPPAPHLPRPPVPSVPNVIYYQSNQLHLGDKLQPSPSSCLFNLRWRHLETSLIKGLTGS